MDATLKKEKLEEIESEVGSFHPLLRSLLPNLPEIRNVDYTHGNTECGADFILTRFDNILEDTIYVGVIVKIGKIHSDTSEIEKQINECGIERFVLGGKREIFLSEIWVLTNSSITSEAKKRIHHNHSNKNVVFYDYQKLIRWIDRYLPNYWINASVEVSSYLQALSKDNSQLEKSLSLIEGAKVGLYVEQDICEKIPEYDPDYKKVKKVDIHEAIKRKKILIIDGGMGSGKSRLIRRLIDHYSKGEVYSESKLLPIYTSYVNLIDKEDSDIVKLISNALGETVFSAIGESQQYLLLIDGVDEKQLSSEEQAKKISEIIDTLSSRENIKAVITTRPIGGNNLASGDKVSIYSLMPLNNTRIIEFLSRICQDLALPKRTFQDIKKSALFKHLPKNPIAAIMLANLISENSKDLPSNITELYAKYIELMLGRWDMKKGLQSQKEYQTADIVLMNIAEFLFRNNLDSMSYQEALNAFDTYLEVRNLGIDSKYILDKVISRSGLLFLDSRSDRVYFKHRTFVEFLFSRSLNGGAGLKIDLAAFNIYWSNIFFFYIGLKKDCPDILQELVDLVPNDDVYSFNKIVQMGEYYLAGYASPYLVVRENLHKIMIEASKLYCSIVQGKSKSELFTRHSEVHLLWLFQAFIRESYSFEYFRNAIPDVNLHISYSEGLTEDEKCFALFFLGVIEMDLEFENPFNFLLAFKKELPMTLRIGVFHEGDKLSRKSDLLKRVIKKFRQAARIHEDTHQLISSLYQKPISQKIKSLLPKKRQGKK